MMVLCKVGNRLIGPNELIEALGIALKVLHEYKEVKRWVLLDTHKSQ